MLEITEKQTCFAKALRELCFTRNVFNTKYNPRQQMCCCSWSFELRISDYYKIVLRSSKSRKKNQCANLKCLLSSSCLRKVLFSEVMARQLYKNTISQKLIWLFRDRFYVFNCSQRSWTRPYWKYLFSLTLSYWVLAEVLRIW